MTSFVRRLVFALATCSATLVAEVKLPSLLQDGMVLQRGIPIHLWGMAEPREKVTGEFRGEKKSTIADSLGRWHLYLASAEAGGPYRLTISAANTIQLNDVLVGDVWLASGQSNMEFRTERLQDPSSELTQADLPNVRLFQVERASAEYPQADVTSHGWQHCSSRTAAKFSAVAFLFAREIHRREKVPMGVIESTWGGTSIESWTSLEAIGADPTLSPVFEARGKRMEQQAERELLRKQSEAAKSKGFSVPELPWRPDPPMWSLSQIYNAMIAPLSAFPIRGVIWYQGEANTRLDGAPDLYGRQLTILIEDWRHHWAIGDFPFFFVQLANFRSDASEDWPAVREGQRQALQLRNTGMAVAIDIGNPDDVHPLNKQDVAARLALNARAQVYGEAVEYSGPLFRQLTREQSSLRVWLDHASGLQAKRGTVAGFEIAGVDGKFHPAAAMIDGPSILLSSSDVAAPVSARYAWANDPKCDLFNTQGLPASPFHASLTGLH